MSNVALLRQAVVEDSVRLALIDEPAQRERSLMMIGFREAMIRLVANDSTAELEEIDREIEAHFRRSA